MVTGVAAGWGAFRRALRRVSAAWMAVLLMPQVTRSRAVTLATLAAVPWQVFLAGLLAAWVGVRGGNDGPACHALAFAAVFAGGFVAVVLSRQRWQSMSAARIIAQPDGAASPASKRPHWIGWLRGIDTARPRLDRRVGLRAARPMADVCHPGRLRRVRHLVDRGKHRAAMIRASAGRGRLSSTWPFPAGLTV